MAVIAYSMWTQNCSKNVIPNFGEGIAIQREYKIDSSFHASAKSRENGTMGQSLVDWTVAFLILQLEKKARMWKNKVNPSIGLRSGFKRQQQ